MIKFTPAQIHKQYQLCVRMNKIKNAPRLYVRAGLRFKNGPALGICNNHNHTIEIERYHPSLPQLIDTILHELSHFLTYRSRYRDGRGHGKHWQRNARKLGAVPTARGLRNA